MRSAVSAVLFGALALVAGCAGEAGSEADAPVVAAAAPLTVYTVNYPLAYLTERIGGDQADVHFPAPAGVDPAHWQPDAEGVGGFQQADLILLSGAGYASWTRTAALPAGRLVDTSADFELPFIVRDQAVTHSHGAEGEHSHEEMATIVWLDLEQASSQAATIARTLAGQRPEHAADFERRLEALRQDLEAIDREMAALLEPHRDRVLLASHPLYDYFARRFQLELVSFTWEAQEAPSEKMWAELDHAVAHQAATLMLWEAEPLAETAALLVQRGITSIVVDPCGSRPAEGDFLSVMRSNLDNLRTALGT